MTTTPRPVFPVDLAAIDREAFTVETRQTAAGPLVLVCPKKQKLKWEPGEEHLRSLLCRPDGEVVSCGFPKFHNYGERPGDDALVDQAVKHGAARWTEKLDGSLVIRSVVDGVVLWRTRGSHELGKFEAPVLQHVRDHHPVLLDPRLAPEANLLFEWTSPDNVIVLRYQESRLTLLGGVAHHVGYPHVFPASALSDWQWTPTVAALDLPADLQGLREAVGAWQDREGVVAWCTTGRGAHLAKFKSARYLALHAFKSHVTERKIWGYCQVRGVRSPDDLRAELDRDGFDFETIEYALPWFGTYLQRLLAVQDVGQAITVALENLHLPADADRKTRAIAAREACDAAGAPDLFAWALMGWLGEHQRSQDVWDAYVLEMGVNEYRAKRTALAALAVGEAPDE